MIAIDNKAFLEVEDLAYASRTIKEPIIWDFADDLTSFDYVFFKNHTGQIRVIKGKVGTGKRQDSWSKNIDEVENLIEMVITWPSIWISFEANGLIYGPNKASPKGHVCDFIDPGIGSSEWCKHEGCTIERPKFVRHR